MEKVDASRKVIHYWYDPVELRQYGLVLMGLCRESTIAYLHLSGINTSKIHLFEKGLGSYKNVFWLLGLYTSEQPRYSGNVVRFRLRKCILMGLSYIKRL
jgi:hypothetical protein